MLTCSACATNTTERVRTVSNYCLLAKGISFSDAQTRPDDHTNRYDTPATVEQVKEHDLVYMKLCESEEVK